MEVRDCDAERKLWRATVVTIFFVLSELIAGYLIGSILIVSDALHMLSHAAGFIVSLICLYFARRKRSEHYTWGYLRTEIVGALCSMAIVWIITVIVIVEGINKLILIINNELDEPVDGLYMFLIAVYAMVCNFFIIMALNDGSSHGHGHGDGHGHSHGLQFSTVSEEVEAHGHSYNKNEHGHSHGDDKHEHNIKDEKDKHNRDSHSKDGHHGHSHGDDQDGDSESEDSVEAIEDSEIIHEHGHAHGCGGYNHAHTLGQPVNPSHYLSQFQSIENPMHAKKKHRKQKTKKMIYVNQTSARRVNKSQRSKGESETFNTAEIESQKPGLPTSTIAKEESVDHPTTSIIISKDEREIENEPNQTVAIAISKQENSLPPKPPKIQENLNIAAANAHIIGDLFQSVGVLIAGAIVWGFPGDQYPLVQIIDPVATLFFTFPVLYTTIGVTRACFRVLMEGVPPHIKLKDIETAFKEIEHVENVHKLHVWAVSTNTVCLSVHLSLPDQNIYTTTDVMNVVDKAQNIAREHGIHESTIQVGI